MPSDSEELAPARASAAEQRRARLLTATVDVVGERGWEATTLTEVVTRAGLSKRTVYDLFEDKLSCFLAAARELTDRVSTLTLAAYRDADAPRAGLAAAIRALLEFCGESPRSARVYLVETAAAGPHGAELWRRHMDAMAERAACAVREVRGDLPAHVGSMAIGGVYAVAQRRVLAGQAPRLPELAPEITKALYVTLGIR
jgi:AcrR family transcriptional regulator